METPFYDGQIVKICKSGFKFQNLKSPLQISSQIIDINKIMAADVGQFYTEIREVNFYMLRPQNGFLIHPTQATTIPTPVEFFHFKICDLVLGAVPLMNMAFMSYFCYHNIANV